MSPLSDDVQGITPSLDTRLSFSGVTSEVTMCAPLMTRRLDIGGGASHSGAFCYYKRTNVVEGL
ncbi:hypothetical protein AFERRI_420011 [Acidithiobacillus ferrivorans]|uniref:Uncharacterized protein n=1 Tax=Acidithiobacillus ferrivorans TaxID=160808 RepID=A0A060UVA5_9PROT|nr:hypothetical protein AFERRI_420011 [Acidithiobacillus ferrivorans]